MILPLPMMFWLSTRLKPAANLSVFVLLVCVSVFLWNASPNVIRYLYCFYIGVALPELLKSGWIRTITANGWVTIAAVALLIPVEFLYVSNRLWLPYKLIINTLASAQVIAFVLLKPQCSAVQRLNIPSLVWLGNISYSFYVFSFVVQIAVATALLKLYLPVGNNGATVLTLAVTILTVTVTAAISAASKRWIEVPGMNIGKRWSRWIERRTTAQT